MPEVATPLSFQNRVITIPMRMANTAPPIIGKLFPRK